jgi:hypothetical protein
MVPEWGQFPGQAVREQEHQASKSFTTVAGSTPVSR